MCLRLFKCFREVDDDSFTAHCFSEGNIRLLFKVDYKNNMSPLSSSDVECLGSVLASKPKWKSLSVCVSDVSIEILHQFIATNAPTIHKIALKLYTNSISSSNLITEIALLCKTTTLSIIGTFCTATIVTSLKENKFLKVLYLYYLPLCIEETELLDEQSLQALKYNKILRKLVIYKYFLHPEQCWTIGQSIKQINRNIKVQIFQDISSSFSGAKKIFEYTPDMPDHDSNQASPDDL